MKNYLIHAVGGPFCGALISYSDENPSPYLFASCSDLDDSSQFQESQNFNAIYRKKNGKAFFVKLYKPQRYDNRNGLFFPAIAVEVELIDPKDVHESNDSDDHDDISF